LDSGKGSLAYYPNVDENFSTHLTKKIIPIQIKNKREELKKLREQNNNKRNHKMNQGDK